LNCHEEIIFNLVLNFNLIIWEKIEKVSKSRMGKRGIVTETHDYGTSTHLPALHHCIESDDTVQGISNPQRLFSQ